MNKHIEKNIIYDSQKSKIFPDDPKPYFDMQGVMDLELYTRDTSLSIF